MSVIQRRARAAAWGVALLLLLGPLASAQAPPLSFEALVEGDIPAWGLSDRLDVCLEQAEEQEEERETAESARRARLRESQTAAALARTNELIEQVTRDPQVSVDPGVLEELGQELEAMFPSSEELRFETCQVLHERARWRLEIAGRLEACYRAAFEELGVAHLAPPEVDTVPGVRAAAIRGFACPREIQPMETEVTLAPGETVVLAVSTVCLEADLSRPGDGESYEVTPDPVTPEVLELLRAAAADPATLADVQEAVWSGKPGVMSTGAGRQSGAEESYKVWEHDPTNANCDQALQDFKAVEQVGGPPDASSDAYDSMLADLAGE